MSAFRVIPVLLFGVVSSAGAEIGDCIVQPISRDLVTIIAVVREVSLQAVEQSRAACGVVAQKQNHAVKHFLVVTDLQHARNWTLRMATPPMRTWIRERKIGEAIEVPGISLARFWDGNSVGFAGGWTLDISGYSAELVHIAPWWLPSAVLRVPRLYFVSRRQASPLNAGAIREAMERKFGTGWEYSAYFGAASEIEKIEGFTAVTPFAVSTVNSSFSEGDLVVCESQSGVLSCRNEMRNQIH